MASRKLTDLQPEARARAQDLLRAAEAADFDVLIYCTLRPLDEQARLFRQGRPLSEIQDKADQLDRQYGRPDLASLLMEVGPQYGTRIVTWAGPGQSLHNYGMALDAVPLQGGKPVWSTDTIEDRALWMRYGELGVEAGFQWAGHWPERKREYPHMQMPDMRWRELIRSPA
ncbi:MAG TPA: hypothetical protein ENK00_01475 [Chromatiales bacterium]|nr:hypothetical protein [Chromatiales bacterium]